MPSRILIADDHEVLRQGVRALLEAQKEWVICGEAVNGQEVVKKAKELNPDVIILDVTMPGFSGLEAARQILATRPDTRIIIFSMHDSEEILRQAKEVGVRGYVRKSEAGRKLVDAVGALLRNHTFFSPSSNKR